MLLQQIQSCLEQLEQDLDNKELYNELFRLIHTIKGMASTLMDEPYFEDITQLSHSIESILEHPVPQLSSVQIYLIGDAIQVLHDLVEVVAHPDQLAPTQQLEVVYRNFQSIMPQFTPLLKNDSPGALPSDLQTLSEDDANILKAALSQKKPIFQLDIHLMPDCLMKSVRALLVLHNVESAGKILATKPPLQALREGHFAETFTLYLHSEEQTDTIQRLSESVSEIEHVDVHPYTEGENNHPSIATVSALKKAEEDHSGRQEIPDLNEFEEHVLIEAHKQGLNAVWLRFHVTRPLSLMSARIALIFRYLENRGEVIKTVPEVQLLENEKFNKSFSMLLISSQSSEELKSALVKESEIQTCFHIDAYLNGSQPPELPTAPDISTTQEATVYIGADLRARKNFPLTTIPPEARTTGNAKESERLKSIRMQHLVRVDADQLKQLNELTGELLVARARLNQISDPTTYLQRALASLNQVTASIQSVSMQLQTITSGQVFNRYPRMIRDLARSLGKDISCCLEGEQIEIDRAYVDDLSSILLHMIRNSADHGLETSNERLRHGKKASGTIMISASYRDQEVCIEVMDDGRGIDVAALKNKAIESGLISPEEADYMTYQEAMELIFKPGLSTSQATTDISGRGVGMDVVLNHVRQVGGQLYIHSRAGQGSRFTILLPSELTQVQSVLVRVAQQYFALPLNKIKYIQQLGEVPEGIQIISLQNLSKINDLTIEQSKTALVLTIETPEQTYGLLADELIGYRQLAIKSLTDSEHQDIVQGAAMLDPNNLALYLDPTKIQVSV